MMYFRMPCWRRSISRKLGVGSDSYDLTFLPWKKKTEVIDAKVEMRTVSRSGKESEPTVLDVYHEGG